MTQNKTIVLLLHISFYVLNSLLNGKHSCSLEKLRLQPRYAYFYKKLSLVSTSAQKKIENHQAAQIDFCAAFG